jgi:polyketide cyclase/dehydrase/lipid transport protein
MLGPREQMVRIEQQRRFAVPVERGFDYITDQSNWPEYWPGFVRLEPGSAWGEPGDRTRLVLRVLGRETTLELTLRRHERPRVVEYDSVQQGLPDARHRRLFEPVAGGFDYTVIVEYEPRHGLRGLLDRTLVRILVGRIVRRTLDNVGRALER